MDPLSALYLFPLHVGLKIQLHTSAIAAILCRFMTQTRPRFNKFSIVIALSQWSPVQIERNASLQETEALHGQKTGFYAYSCKGGE